MASLNGYDYDVYDTAIFGKYDQTEYYVPAPPSLEKGYADIDEDGNKLMWVYADRNKLLYVRWNFQDANPCLRMIPLKDYFAIFDKLK